MNHITSCASIAHKGPWAGLVSLAAEQSVVFRKGLMKHILAFSVLVFIPMLVVYIHQRENDRYKGFGWSKVNDIGLFITFLLFVFILLASYISPEFVSRYNEGWHHRRSNEYSYTIWWFIGLLLLTFPHVCKRSAWPLFPSAMQSKSLYKTKWFSIGGIFLVSLSAIKTLSICQR